MSKTTKAAKPGALMMAQAGNMKLTGPVKPAKPAKKTSAKKKA